MKVVVVGGGISGLATAHALAELVPPELVEIEVREADDRLGGKLKTTPFAGLRGVDEGADAFLARVPDATELARRVGLGDALTSPTAARAAVMSRGRLHPIPDGLVLGVPASVTGLATSGLLSWRGKLRAAVEPLIPARDPGDSIGALVRHRFGDEVHERLVDALVGTIYGADTDRFSLAMVPQLAALAGRGRSLLLSARRMRAAAHRRRPARCSSLRRAGMGALTDAVAGAARASGVTIRIVGAGHRARPGRRPLAGRRRAGRRRRARHPGRADGAAPRRAPRPRRPGCWRRWTTPAWCSSRSPSTGGRSGCAATAGTSSRSRSRRPSRRCPSARRSGPTGGRRRPGDPARVARTGRAAGRRPRRHRGRRRRRRRRSTGTSASTCSRRMPASAAGRRRSRSTGPHHRQWLDRVDAALPAGLFVTGASYRGIGIPACVAQAEATARAVATLLLHPRV